MVAATTPAPRVKWNRSTDRTLNQMVSDLRSDFRAAHDTRFMSRLSGVSHAGSGADYHYRFERDFLHMMERSRQYERDNPVIGQGISRLAANIIQDGFSPDPVTNSPDLNSRLKDLWEEWSSESNLCHSEGEHSFRVMEELVFRSAIRDGDMFALPLKNGSIQLIEAHRPRTPRNTTRNVVHGILLDDMARRLELWLSKEDIGLNQTLSLVSDTYRVPWKDSDGNHQVFQVFFPKRTSQRRGYPAVAPVSDTVGQSDDLFFTTLVKAQMNALIVLLEEQSLNGMAGTGATSLSQEETTVNEIPGIQAGLHVKVADGRTIKGHAPQVPNAEFFTHANLLLTFVAINLEMPVAMLLLDASNTNFSGWRGTIDQARVRFRYLQKVMRDQFHKPIYEWKVRQWLMLDPLVQKFAARPGVSPLKHRWKIPGWPYIEPFKDIQADSLSVEKFLSSPRRVVGARGNDWPEIASEFVEDKGLLIIEALEKAKEINEAYPEAGLTWREILGPGLNSTSVMVPSDEPVGAKA